YSSRFEKDFGSGAESGREKSAFRGMVPVWIETAVETAHAPSIGIIRTGTKGLSQHAGQAGEYPCVWKQYTACAAWRRTILSKSAGCRSGRRRLFPPSGGPCGSGTRIAGARSKEMARRVLPAP